MKTLITCALVALLPASLLASDNIGIETTLVQAKSRRMLPHDLKKLSATKGVNVLSAPRVTTRAGMSTEVAMTRDLHVPSVVPGARATSIPMGVIVRVTPHRMRDGIAYDAHITIREYESSTPGMRPQATLTSHELHASGRSENGEQVWLDFPNRAGQATTVRLVFSKRSDA